MNKLCNLIFCVLPFIGFGQARDCTPTILLQNITANNPNPNGEVEQASNKIRLGYNVGHPIFATGPVIFDVNSEIFLQAANEITFEPGFKTKLGALMVAYIAPCSDNPCPPEDSFLGGNISVNEITKNEYKYEIEITIPVKMKVVEVEIMNPEAGTSFFETLTRQDGDFINNKAPISFPLYDTTSVCGNYNIEVRGQFCDGTEDVETLNWDRYQLSPVYGQPSLDYIFSTSMSCTIGQNCWLEIETSRAIGYLFDLEDNGNNFLASINFQNGKEEISKQYQLFNMKDYQPGNPDDLDFIIEGVLIGHCKNLEPVLIEINVDYVE